MCGFKTTGELSFKGQSRFVIKVLAVRTVSFLRGTPRSSRVIDIGKMVPSPR